MPSSVTDEQLRRYLTGTLSAAARRRVEAALRESPRLRDRLNELRREADMIQTVKDAQAIRPDQCEEDRIMGGVRWEGNRD